MGSITVEVGPGVFIPRPETELLVDWAVSAIADVPRPVVVDLCTGTAAIALASRRRDRTRPCTPWSGTRRRWPGPDATSTGTPRPGHTKVRLRGGDFTDPRLLADLDGTVDLVTANPPYVPDDTPVEPEVADHDPPLAVFAGADGLDVIRPLVNVAAGLLKPGGVLAIEHDDTQGESVPALLSGRRVLADVVDHADLTGRPRFVTARRVRLGHT